VSREFKLPDIGEGLAEAEILRWMVAVGDEVAVDQVIVEVETDKAVVEIPSPFAGTVQSLGATEGEMLEVGEVLIVIGDGPAAATPEAPEVAPIVGTISSEADDLTRPLRPPAATHGERPLALPVVRKLARDNDIDLSSVKGSGPGGRVTRDDVQAVIGGRAATAPVTTSRPSQADERRTLSKLRRTIAANMARSWAEIPHVTTFDEVDATRLLAVRKALARRHDVSVSLDALVSAAVIPALAAFPDFNSTLEGDELVVHGTVDLGVAVDTDLGLMVAVVADAADRSVLELSAEIARLAAGAKARTLAPTELSGQTFTVSNIGAVGGGHGTPIVPYGTVGILSVGRATDRPIARDGKVEIAPMMPLSLSYDHRVIDGGEGRRFMAMVLENLAEPALFLA
jgi:pyruvate dehydrogenase E2 component (dihydrolipoamide acetyltransferase)